MGSERRGVNGGMKKSVGQWPKREERLRMATESGCEKKVLCRLLRL